MKYTVVMNAITSNSNLKEWREEPWFRKAGITDAQLNKLVKDGILERESRTVSTAGNGFKIETVSFYRAK